MGSVRKAIKWRKKVERLGFTKTQEVCECVLRYYDEPFGPGIGHLNSSTSFM